MSKRASTGSVDYAIAPRLFSINQAASHLGIGRTATYALLKTGRLKSITIGRRRLIPADAIDAFINGLTKGGQ
jgi:excisionase family DNA binding protein